MNRTENFYGGPMPMNEATRKPTNGKQTPLNDVEAADFLGVAVQTLRNWRHLSKGPAYLKLSPGPRGRVVYLQEDLDAYRSGCRVDPEA